MALLDEALQLGRQGLQELRWQGSVEGKTGGVQTSTAFVSLALAATATSLACAHTKARAIAAERVHRRIALASIEPACLRLPKAC